MLKFREFTHPRNLIPAKVYPIKVEGETLWEFLRGSMWLKYASQKNKVPIRLLDITAQNSPTF